MEQNPSTSTISKAVVSIGDGTLQGDDVLLLIQDCRFELHEHYRLTLERIDKDGE